MTSQGKKDKDYVNPPNQGTWGETHLWDEQQLTRQPNVAGTGGETLHLSSPLFSLNTADS